MKITQLESPFNQTTRDLIDAVLLGGFQRAINSSFPASLAPPFIDANQPIFTLFMAQMQFLRVIQNTYRQEYSPASLVSKITNSQEDLPAWMYLTFELTSLPSFLQTISGVGLPIASQVTLKVSPILRKQCNGATLVSLENEARLCVSEGFWFGSEKKSWKIRFFG